MKRIDQICGLAVIDVDSGTRLGDVEEVVIDADKKRVAGILISPRSMIGGSRFVSFGDIRLFGDVSVLIKRNEASNQKRPKECLELGQKVYLTDRSNFGWFTNALIDEANGEIHSLEVSEGYFDDLSRGRNWIYEFSCGKEGITALLNGRIEDAPSAHYEK